MSQKKEQFLNAVSSSNEEWAAKQLLENFTEKEVLKIKEVFKKMDDVLYKSWAKSMTFSELKEAIEMAVENI